MIDGADTGSGGAVEGRGGSGGVGVRLLWTGGGSTTGDWIRLDSRSVEDVSGVVDPRKSKLERACCGENTSQIIRICTFTGYMEQFNLCTSGSAT